MTRGIMRKVIRGCHALALVASLSLVVGAVGCSGGVDSTGQHTTVDGGWVSPSPSARPADGGAGNPGGGNNPPAPSPSDGTCLPYICPADDPEAPADCDQHFFENASKTGQANGAHACGQKMNDTCTADVIPVTGNEHCDDKQNEYQAKFDEVINAQCEVDATSKEAAKAHMDCTDETNECNDATKEEGEAENECARQTAEEKAECHCEKMAQECEKAVEKDRELKQKQAELKCKLDDLANAQCEFAGCLTEPECNCGLGLHKGSGSEGAGCSSGDQCASGLCTVNPETPQTAGGQENGSCAATPPSFCCLSYANGACNDPDLEEPMPPPQCPPSPSDGGGEGGGY